MALEADIDYTKSAQENAEEYFKKAKELEKKAKGAAQAVLDLEKKKKEIASKGTREKKLKQIKKREWYEKYNWFFTSSGMLAIGGRSAQQNEEINSKYFEQGDLFFHANIFGASAVVLKEGAKADEKTREEAAQFAACYSKAWEDKLSAVDVFAARRDQVSKSSQNGYVSPGSFLITGEREWFRNVKLELYACLGKPDIEINRSGIQDNAVLNLVPNKLIVETSGLIIMPAIAYEHGASTGKAVRLRPGNVKKSDAAKEIAKKLGFEDIDYIIQHLPAGGFSID